MDGVLLTYYLKLYVTKQRFDKCALSQRHWHWMVGVVLRQDRLLITIGWHRYQIINRSVCTHVLLKLTKLKHLKCGLMCLTLLHPIDCSLYNYNY